MQRDSPNHHSHTRLEVLEPHPHPPASLCLHQALPSPYPKIPPGRRLASLSLPLTRRAWESRARALPRGCSAARISRTGKQGLPARTGRVGCGQTLPARPWPGRDSHPGHGSGRRNCLPPALGMGRRALRASQGAPCAAPPKSHPTVTYLSQA